jgi:hypothetical protein
VLPTAKGVSKASGLEIYIFKLQKILKKGKGSPPCQWAAFKEMNVSTMHLYYRQYRINL